MEGGKGDGLGSEHFWASQREGFLHSDSSALTALLRKERMGSRTDG